MFECDYKINPYHDINGVGLLYFATYPSIADTCELAYMNHGNSWAERSSTVFRDIFYFANSDADETLLYSVVGRRDVGNEIEIDALISRKDSGIPMAFVTTRKATNGW
jgi:probable biosynthetic protein (TIGR04098 family)